MSLTDRHSEEGSAPSSKRFVKFGGALLLVLMSAILGYLVGIPLPVTGGGQFKESPDKMWIAAVLTQDYCPILGVRRTYYNFTITSTSEPKDVIRKLSL